MTKTKYDQAVEALELAKEFEGATISCRVDHNLLVLNVFGPDNREHKLAYELMSAVKDELDHHYHRQLDLSNLFGSLLRERAERLCQQAETESAEVLRIARAGR